MTLNRWYQPQRRQSLLRPLAGTSMTCPDIDRIYEYGSRLHQASLLATTAYIADANSETPSGAGHDEGLHNPLIPYLPVIRLSPDANFHLRIIRNV